MAFWEYCFSECPLFKQGAFWKTVLPECHGFQTRGHSAQNAMVSKQGAFCPECHGFWTGGHSTQNAMVSVSSVHHSRCSLKHLSLREKWYKPVNNVKIPPFSSGLLKRCRPRASKTALGPPALGQFWRPSAGIFSRVPRKKVEFWPRITKIMKCTGTFPTFCWCIYQTKYRVFGWNRD